jgi:hypothetical protein
VNRKQAAAALALLCFFIVGAGSSWNRWGDLIIDSGRELDTPRQLAEGQVLYRDVRYYYGPFAPYLNALVYGVGGVDVGSLTTAGLVSAALLVWLSYRTCRLFTGRLAAVATGAVVVFANAFGHLYPLHIFNFVLPYSYPATYGAIAGILSLYGLIRHIQRERKLHFWISCVGLAVAALCKLEILFAVASMHLVFIALTVIGRQWKTYYLFGYALAGLIPAGIYGVFYLLTGPALLTDNLFTKGNIDAVGFITQHSGLRDISTSLYEIGLCAGIYLACIALIGLAGYLGSLHRGMLLFSSAIALVFGAAAIYFMGPLLALRASPFVLLGMFVVHTARSIRSVGDVRATEMTIAVLSSLGFAGLARIFFKAGAEHYGFYLSIPAILACAVVLTRDFPIAVFRRFGVYSPAYYGGVVMLAALAATHLTASVKTARQVYRPSAPSITTPEGTLPMLGLYAGSVDRVVQDLIVYAQDKSVVVLPEGAALTFLAGAKNPLGVHSFTPLDLVGAYDEKGIIGRLNRAQPDFIVLNSRDVTEYGKTALGLDYGQALMNWVEEHYDVFQGYSTKYYRVTLLRRKQ